MIDENLCDCLYLVRFIFWLYFRKFKLSTPAQFYYQVLPCNLNSFTFQLQTGKGGFIALMPDGEFEDIWIEVLLGIQGNTKSFVNEKTGDTRDNSRNLKTFQV